MYFGYQPTVFIAFCRAVRYTGSPMNSSTCTPLLFMSSTNGCQFDSPAALYFRSNTTL